MLELYDSGKIKNKYPQTHVSAYTLNRERSRALRLQYGMVLNVNDTVLDSKAMFQIVISETDSAF